MIIDIHLKTMLENWGLLAEMGEWEVLEKAVNLYLEMNPPLVYSGTSDSLSTSAGSQLQTHQHQMRQEHSSL